MNGYEQELHIGDQLFDSMREDADMVLQKLLKNMVEKDSMEGSVTIRIDVTLTQEFIKNRDPEIDGETRRVLIPKFSHKVGSVMQIKNEAKGDRNCEGNELVWDSEKGEYILKPIANTEQMTIFDADFKCVNDPDAEEADTENDGMQALEGRCVAFLPGPAENDSDVDDDRESKDTDDMDIEGFGNESADDISEEFEYAEDDGYSYEEPEEFYDEQG